ncbi:hypothetical protein [Clostridium pasteurianum]|uniref:Uncharacterized protein n=1 Tax=Clostridium pasteurianum BC1 TaxID=86416 RepID=R4K1Q5_CLOPA|nr:hypothetical protein [Clostridium pasteurianum]AGK95716.1 hypothetical protein Clopa_0674 [Clostridium pasteurianum BC1]
MHDFLFSKIKFPFPVSITLLAVVWILEVVALIYILKRPGKDGESTRWTTKDIITLAILSVILMVFNSVINDRLLGPLFKSIPLIGSIVDLLHFKDFPLLFFFLLAVVLVRRPGAIIAMLFIKYILEQLIYGGSGINPLDWPVAIMQGLFVELYLIGRNGKVFLQKKWIFVDAILICLLKELPPDFYKPIIGSPVIHGSVTTVLKVANDIWTHIVGYSILAVILVPLVIQVAKSLNALNEIDDDENKGIEV